MSAELPPNAILWRCSCGASGMLHGSPHKGRVVLLTRRQSDVAHCDKGRVLYGSCGWKPEEIAAVVEKAKA